jgi:methanethiol S-methyltransferase
MSKRILFFAYGSLSYLIFLGTFLYAVCFVGAFGVPRTLDGAASGPLGLSFAIDAGLLALFAVQHSVMARKWFKDWWTRIVPKPIERSTYVLLSSLALILLFTQWRPLGGDLLDGQRLHSRGGQFNRQRHAVESPANLRHGR